MKRNQIVLSDNETVYASCVGKRVEHNVYGSCIRYRIKIQSKEHPSVHFSFGWSDSVNEYCNGNRTMTPDKFRDAVYCGISDAFSYCNTRGFNDFVDEFGYSLDTNKEYNQARKVYVGCGTMYEKFGQLLSDDEMCDFLNNYDNQ